MEWFKSWFNEDYLLAYAGHSTADAAEQVLALQGWLAIEDRRVLDLGCGPGRHLAPLAKHAKFVTGVDLSGALLGFASRALPKNASLVLSDLRALPFAPGSFDLLTCFFTGFGYLESDAAHTRMLQGWWSALRPGGELLLDYINKDHLLDSFEPETRRTEGQVSIEERRSIVEGRIEKELRFSVPRERPRTYRESVRLYSPGEIESLLEAAGFGDIRLCGDFSGAALEKTSVRLVVAAKRI